MKPRFRVMNKTTGEVLCKSHGRSHWWSDNAEGKLYGTMKSAKTNAAGSWAVQSAKANGHELALQEVRLTTINEYKI